MGEEVYRFVTGFRYSLMNFANIFNGKFTLPLVEEFPGDFSESFLGEVFGVSFGGFI